MKIKCCLFALLPALLPLAPVHAQVVVNEYSCANLGQFTDYYLGAEDWIELYNAGSASVNLAGFHLSDKKSKPDKYTFPANTTLNAGAFLKIWCSGRNLKDPAGFLHTNFKLTQTGNADHIVFADPSGTILEDINIEKTQAGQSRGRLTDGSNEWRIFTQATPGASNDNHPSALTFAARPEMSLSAGFYQGPQTLTITTTEPNALIRYTLDGTEPGPTAELYSGPVTLNQTTVVKAAAYSSDPLILPSFVQFNTYFIDEDHTLAVVSVAGEQLLELANGNQGLKPVGSIEYFDKNTKERKARTYGELNSHGQDSWANDQRSLDWISRDQMGYNAVIKEKLLPLTDRDEFQRIILRAAGDDNYPASHHPQNQGSAHVRDAYIHNLAKRGGLNLDVRTAEKCIVYLNGNYWGVYDIREIPDDHDFTEYYYNQDEYNLQYVETWGSTWAQYGGNQALSDWHSIRSFILGNNMNDPVKFQYVKDHFDYTSLIDYVIVNSFTVCTDWLNYNTGIWRGLNPEGSHQKWGYILWDNDATFDHYINYTGLPSTQPNAKPCNPESLSGSSDPEQHIKILNKLRTNPEVQQYYLARQADLMYTVFGCDNMLSYLDTIEALIDPEMTRHAVRWTGTYHEWKVNIEQMREFITARCSLLPTLMDDCYQVTGPYSVVVQTDPPGIADLKINTLQYPAAQLPVNGHYFGGAQVNLELNVVKFDSTTYRFDHWSALQNGIPDSLSRKVSMDLAATDTIVAHFTALNTPVLTPPGEKDLPSFSANPTVFSSVLDIRYYLPEQMQVNFRLFDALGNLIDQKDVPASGAPAGVNTLKISTADKNLPQGIYFLTFTAGNFEKTVRLIRI